MVDIDIGFDFDGTVSRPPLPPYNPSIRMPRLVAFFLFFPQLHLSVLARPNREVIEDINRLVLLGNRVWIVSARPREVVIQTESRARRWGVMFTGLYCVGPEKGSKQRKVEALSGKRVKVYFGDEFDKGGKVCQFYAEYDITLLPKAALHEMVRGKWHL